MLWNLHSVEYPKRHFHLVEISVWICTWFCWAKIFHNNHVFFFYTCVSLKKIDLEQIIQVLNNLFRELIFFLSMKKCQSNPIGPLIVDISKIKHQDYSNISRRNTIIMKIRLQINLPKTSTNNIVVIITSIGIWAPLGVRA